MNWTIPTSIRMIVEMRSPWIRSLAAGIVVMLAILLAGGPERIDVLILAMIGAATFFDLARRGFAETDVAEGDATDFWMSASFALVLVAAAWSRRGRPEVLLVDGNGPELATGVFLIALGLVLRQWTARTMGKEFLVRLDLPPGHRLVDSGPFRTIRHPSYAALLLVAIGTAIALESLLALLVALGLWLPVMILRVRREERLLGSRFGQVWETYRRRTHRLIPGLY